MCFRSETFRCHRSLWHTLPCFDYYFWSFEWRRYSGNTTRRHTNNTTRSAADTNGIWLPLRIVCRRWILLRALVAKGYRYMLLLPWHATLIAYRRSLRLLVIDGYCFALLFTVVTADLDDTYLRCSYGSYRFGVAMTWIVDRYGNRYIQLLIKFC